MPTPGAVGYLIEMIAQKENITAMGVDIGGATTDIFSVFQGIFNRTVSANLGMSYSICNVLAEATLGNILRWVPFTIDEEELTNRIANKMIRPTTIPQSLNDLKIEQAIAREALRLSFMQHKSFAVSLKGVQTERTISDAFEQAGTGGTLVDMMALDLLIGSGGVLSHAPRRNQAAHMMIDAFLPEGITELAVDSIFMMPQLGVLANIQEDEIKQDAQEAALHVFDKDCLIRLGTCIAPVGRAKKGKPLLRASLTLGDGSPQEYELMPGEMIRIEVPLGQVTALLEPEKGIDVGAGPGEQISANINGGAVGIVLDGRGRPLVLPEDDSARMDMLKKWSEALEEYPE
jgi:hypothetical protein